MPLVLSIIDQGLRYSLFLIFKKGAILKFRKWLYLNPRAKIEEKKGHFVFSKMPSIFSIIAQPFLYFLSTR